ncbi:MAG: hypothetical protein H7Y32_15630 [Chloroflexales bacterium]|nr:hypothetical protein [Chloroflexales bacterium]
MPVSTPWPIEAPPPLARQLVTFLLPMMEVTLRIPLPIAQARQRLEAQMAIGMEQTIGGGIFTDRRHYQGQISGDQLVVRGPFGHKKWRLATRGFLRHDPIGSALDLQMRLDGSQVLMAACILLPFFCFMTVILSGSPWFLAAFFALGGTFLYGVILISVKVEAEMIKDLIFASLSNP